MISNKMYRLHLPIANILYSRFCKTSWNKEKGQCLFASSPSPHNLPIPFFFFSPYYGSRAVFAFEIVRDFSSVSFFVTIFSLILGFCFVLCDIWSLGFPSLFLAYILLHFWPLTCSFFLWILCLVFWDISSLRLPSLFFVASLLLFLHR